MYTYQLVFTYFASSTYTASSLAVQLQDSKIPKFLINTLKELQVGYTKADSTKLYNLSFYHLVL